MTGRHLLKFFGLGPGRQWLLLEAWITLGLSRGMVKTLPFRWIAPGLQARLAKPPPAGAAAAHIDSVAWAIRVARRYTPWNSNCLAQGIAAKRMLQRRGLPSTLVLGVRKDEEFEAHAWLRCSGQILTGADEHETYSVVSTFSDQGV